jgi:hypothetical protein
MAEIARFVSNWVVSCCGAVTSSSAQGKHRFALGTNIGIGGTLQTSSIIAVGYAVSFCILDTNLTNAFSRTESSCNLVASDTVRLQTSIASWTTEVTVFAPVWCREVLTSRTSEACCGVRAGWACCRTGDAFIVWIHVFCVSEAWETVLRRWTRASFAGCMTSRTRPCWQEETIVTTSALGGKCTCASLTWSITKLTSCPREESVGIGTWQTVACSPTCTCGTRSLATRASSSIQVLSRGTLATGMIWLYWKSRLALGTDGWGSTSWAVWHVSWAGFTVFGRRVNCQVSCGTDVVT